MIKYIPFLKSKQNEIFAIGELSAETISKICPFFDLHRKTTSNYTPETLKDTVKKIRKHLEKHASQLEELYFDNFDIDGSLQVDGKNNYFYILDNLRNLPVIPVASIDRDIGHLEAIRELKNSGIISQSVIAFRVTVDDFESFPAIQDEIEEDLSDIFELFEEVDLILDCRLCKNLEVSTVSRNALRFSRQFCSTYPTRRVVITGSSIPASIRDLMPVNTQMTISRREVEIFRNIIQSHDHNDLIFGDYATVSPLYTDTELSPQILQNVMTAKLTYSFEDKHYLVRGSGIKTGHPQQYNRMAQTICNESFYRGEHYSTGDLYLAEKARLKGKRCTPNTVIKPSIVSHITYTAGINFGGY